MANMLTDYLKGAEDVLRFVKGVGITVSLHTLDEKLSPEVIDFMVALMGTDDRRMLYEEFEKAESHFAQKLFKLWTLSIRSSVSSGYWLSKGGCGLL